jgi:hypothetical protein
VTDLAHSIDMARGLVHHSLGTARHGSDFCHAMPKTVPPRLIEEDPPITSPRLGGGLEVVRPETRCDQYPTSVAWQSVQSSPIRRPRR